MKIKTLTQCKYGRSEYAKGKEFDVPDAIAADMVLNKDARLVGGGTRDLLKQYKDIEGKFKKDKYREQRPSKPIKVKKKARS